MFFKGYARFYYKVRIGIFMKVICVAKFRIHSNRESAKRCGSLRLIGVIVSNISNNEDFYKYKKEGTLVLAHLLYFYVLYVSLVTKNIKKGREWRVGWVNFWRNLILNESTPGIYSFFCKKVIQEKRISTPHRGPPAYTGIRNSFFLNNFF
jgi:hypothetical protein